jgi:hypothetical protein
VQKLLQKEHNMQAQQTAVKTEVQVPPVNTRIRVDESYSFVLWSGGRWLVYKGVAVIHTKKAHSVIDAERAARGFIVQHKAGLVR